MVYYDCIIIGGSYAGLSAALSLGRAQCNVLIVDEGKPANQHADGIHNFLGWEGLSPQRLQDTGMKELQAYPTIKYINGSVIDAEKLKSGFSVTLQNGELFQSKYLLFATGVKDKLPDIPGFAECWGRTLLHCPYCHGYEVKNELTGLIESGDAAMDFATTEIVGYRYSSRSEEKSRAWQCAQSSDLSII